MTSVLVEIHGTDLPGRRCGPSPDGGNYENVHVGLKHRDGPIELVPGDAPSARWELELTVRRRDDELDYGGPFVYGRRGERALGLVWGTLDDTFEIFRAAKLRLEDVDPALVEESLEGGARVVGSLGLTDDHGWPRCASVRPPDIVWSVTGRTSADASVH
jgi:Family of unknown function (DUF5990)